MEIRSLQRGEREALLELLDGWEAPSGWRGRAADFFRRYVEDDPSFAEENVWLALEAGRLLSCVQIFPRHVRLRGAEVPVGGIGSVFTRREVRGAGLAARLLERARGAMRERGMELSLLFAGPAGIPLYTRLGWRTWPGNRALLRWSGVPRAAADGVATAPLDPGRDLATVAALHAGYSAARDGTCLRDTEAWQASLRLAGNPEEEFRVARRDGRVMAYARAVAIAGFLVLSELGRGEAAQDAAALAALVAECLTPREPDALAAAERGSQAFRAFAVAGSLDDPALEQALARLGIASSTIPDETPMLSCLDAPALARRLGEPLAHGEDSDAYLRRMLPPARFCFWMADRF